MKQIQNQQQIWDNISPEWHKFKIVPSESAAKFLKESKGKTLDFGSGSGRNLLNLKPNKNQELFLLDFSKKMLNFANKRAKSLKLKIKTTQSDLEKTPFEKDYFDAAIFIAALHCIPTKIKRRKVLKELYRILKPKSKAIISVWNKDSKRFRNSTKERYVDWQDKGKRYYYLYNEEELKSLLENVGFKIKKKLNDRVNIIFIVEKI